MSWFMQNVNVFSQIHCYGVVMYPLQWRHNGHDSVSNQQPHHCLLNRLSRRRSKKTSKLRVTDFCVGNSPVASEFPAQMASNAENFSHLITSSCHFDPSRTMLCADLHTYTCQYPNKLCSPRCFIYEAWLYNRITCDCTLNQGYMYVI